MRNAAGLPVGASTFRRVKIGGQGFITSLDIATDGTMVCTTDVFNGYIKGPTDTAWRPLLTSANMPAGEFGPTAPRSAFFPGGNQGTYAVAIAKTDSSRIYVAFNSRIFVSQNGGTSFTLCSTLAAQDMMANQGAQRLWSRRMAVDPANPDVVIVGTCTNGAFYSADKGATWANITGLTASGTTYGGNTTPILVEFDPNSTVTGGKTQGIYFAKYGTGVYYSSNGGTSVTLTTSTPTTISYMHCDKFGVLWATDPTAAAASSLRKYDATWSTPSGIGVSLDCIASDPASVSKVTTKLFAMDGDGPIQISTDGGATWLGPWYPTYPAPIGNYTNVTALPMLGGNSEQFFPSAVQYDPSKAASLVCAHGLGVARTTPPTSLVRIDWYDETDAIEELVATDILVPPGGKPIACVWDMAAIRISDLSRPATGHLTTFASARGVNRCWGADYAASDPLWIAGIVNGQSELPFISTDGGVTSSRFPTLHPAGSTSGGAIAVTAKNKMIWIPANNARAVYTLDGAVTWNYVTFTGLPTTGQLGWNYTINFNKHLIDADKTIDGVAYAYNYGGDAGATIRGVWKTTDHGANWTQVYSGDVTGSSQYHIKLRCVPGQTGHLFMCAGTDQAAIPLKRSTDGAATWSTVTNCTEVGQIAFGMAAPGKSYPTIFIQGKVSGTYGIYRSDDNCTSWVLQTTYPNNSIDSITALAGDPNVWGRGYVGFSGSGYQYFNASDTASAT